MSCRVTLSWRAAASWRAALWACAVTVTCVVTGLLAGTGSASAHAALISTDPGQGAVVATMPATVSLTFGEPVLVAADGVRVFSPDGAEVDDGHAGHLGRSSTVGVGLPGTTQPGTSRPGPARQGTYTVSWRVISADSHPVAGAFTFSVGHPSAGRAPASAQPRGSTSVGVIYAIVRAAAFASYSLLVGSIAFVLLCWPGAIARRDVRRVMLAGWAGLLATSMATLLLQGPYGNGLGLDRLLDSVLVSETLSSPVGAALTARLALLALAGGYLVLLCAWLGHLQRRGRVWFGALGAVSALGLASTWAAADHAAVGLQPALALPVDVMHLLAMGLWLGGLVTLVVVLPAAGTSSAEAPAALQSAVYRFSSLATGSVVTLIGTGSYQSWRQLGSWGAFGSTDYGRLLLVKLGVFAVMLGVARLSHRWVVQHRRALVGVGTATRPLTGGSTLGRAVVGRTVGGRPALDTTALRASVWGEAALGALVLGVTALLVNAEPGRTATVPPPRPVHHVVSYDTGGPGGRGQLVVDVNPAATGPNTIHVTVDDSRGAPHDVPELRTTLTLATRQLGPFTLGLRHTGVGAYIAGGVQLPYSGTWRLSVTVRTSDIDETTVSTPVDVR
ncbi:MAG: copper resistance protein CopC/CopD [Pseudonocardiales bacterium]|nr:copper resistance protein CopC/CopD [Pseudonocardiales bacterium]